MNIIRKSKIFQKRIEELRNEITEIMKYPQLGIAHIQLAQKHTEIFVAASQLNEISTRRIIRLSWALVILAFALLGVEALAFLGVEIRDVFFPKN